MATIEDYQEDGSALGRINAWHFAFNLAVDRPLVGGGFQSFKQDAFKIYAPEPDNFHDAHSIYFEALGEQGFVGLALFLLLGTLTWRLGTKIIRQTKGNEELAWAHDMASMVQVSVLGYAVGGAFLGLAYYDLYYHLVAIMVIISKIVEGSLKQAGEEQNYLPAMSSGRNNGIGLEPEQYQQQHHSRGSRSTSHRL